jgi:hypothetical protein
MISEAIPTKAMTRAESRRAVLLFAFIAVLSLLPVFAVRYLPLVDLPGHLGRLYILQHYAENPVFQQRYELVRQPLPNISLDLLTPLLAWISMESLARLFVLFSMGVFVLGCGMLSQSVHGYITPLAGLALFAQYNSTFFYGYVQFHCGVAVYLVALALWWRWRDEWTAVRLVVIGLLAVGVYFGHLEAYLFLLLSVGFLTAVGWLRKRSLDLHALVWLPSLSAPLFLYVFAHGPRGDVGRVGWSGLSMKLQHAFILLIGYNRFVDLGVCAALLVAALIAFRSGRIRVQPEMASLAAFFWLLFVVSPSWLATGADADTRFVVPAGVLTLLAIRVEISKGAGRWAFGLALAALIFRIAFISWIWTGQSRLIAESVRLFDQIPIGARVDPMVGFDTGYSGSGLNRAKFELPLVHVISWATVHRAAVVPGNFTVRGQHLVIERPGYALPEADHSKQPGSIDWDSVSRDFDLIWYFGNDAALLRQLERCQLIAATGNSRLYRIVQ